MIVEPYLDPALKYEGSVHCPRGKAKIVSVIDRFDEQKRRASVDRDWNHLHMALDQPHQSLDLSHPRYLDALLTDAEALSAAFDCLRVDFYASDSDYVFGELTNLPAGGLGRFSSPDGAQRFTRAFFA